MRVFVHVSEPAQVRFDHREKVEAILSLLDKHPDPLKRRFIKALCVLLLTPDSYLLHFPAYRAASLIAEFFNFIEERETEVAVRWLPVESATQGLMLINLPDAPYLVDSLQAIKQVQGLSLQVIAHLMLVIKRRAGAIIQMGGLGESGPKESFIALKLAEVEGVSLQKLESDIRYVAEAALAVHRDKQTLSARLHQLEALANLKPWKAFLAWLRQGAFIPFGYYCFRVRAVPQGGIGLCEVQQARLGAPHYCLDGTDWGAAQLSKRGEGRGEDPSLRSEEPQGLRSSGAVWMSPASAERGASERKGGRRQGRMPSSTDPLLVLLRKYHRDGILTETPVLVQQTPFISLLYRPEPLIYIGVEELLQPGERLEHAFLGLFSDAALETLTLDIPALRRKVEDTLEQLHILPDSYAYNKLLELFNLFPKVELFFMGQVQLQLIARSLLLFLHRSDTVKLLVLASPSPSRVALLVLIPLALFEEANLSSIQDYLCRCLQATLERARVIRTTSSYLGVHLVLAPSTEEVHIDINRLERRLTQLASPWEYKFQVMLERALGKESASTLCHKYLKGFSLEYRALTPPSMAIKDVKAMEQVLEQGQQVIDLWRPYRGRLEHHYGLRFYNARESFLDELIPFLENLNLRVIDQVQFTVTIDHRRLFIKSFSVKPAVAEAKPLALLRTPLLEALTALLQGRVENDALNGLLVLTGLSWKQIDVFRGYRNYYFQLGSPFTLSRFHHSLIHNPRVALLLFRYFENRFHPDPRWVDPALREGEGLAPVRLELLASLEAVADINEDRILRTLFNLIDATVRTNFYLRQDQQEYFLAFKISSLGVIDMPMPRPLYEIYVHSVVMEGIHLRGGRVARGGIRWSDRPDDFRTEVLELMKTQMMKNALIVPVGAKGGFVIKHSGGTPEDRDRLLEQAYITFIRGLLDLTDNREGALVQRHPAVVAHDDEDPYLVVAPDKGTAHLSDMANVVAEEYHFWLGDAFASGGSQGYDHKKLGITARGAWECIKRHFRELGTNIETQPFTVVGVGSMDGDVFGNAMLLSPRIRLLAAFGAQHIFIDPDPDPELSYRERQRLFELPGSSWDDYDRSLISKGGGVYLRGAKEIVLSPQVRRWLKVPYRAIDGEGLIRLLLTAPVDLLWLGGVGTYVKASTEKHEEVGDRANDAARVDASEVRARVVGEGANLGFTQKARIQYALLGGCINTDAVDNSAGVDISDHEVNLKILLNLFQQKGLIASVEERNQWLERVKDQICRAVLANNYHQSLCLSLDKERCRRDPEAFLELADRLESGALLDRISESLPHRKEVLARSERCLTRPELAILMAYSKMQLYQALLEQPDFLSSQFLQALFMDYFPQALRERFAEHFGVHPLAKEITATVLCNRVINQAGSSFLTWIGDANSALITDAVAAYLTFDQVLAGAQLRARIWALDNLVPAVRQHALLLRLEDTLAGFCRWTLIQGKRLLPDISTVSFYSQCLEHYEQYLQKKRPEAQHSSYTQEMTELQREGFTPLLARRLVLLPELADFPTLVDLMTDSGVEFSEVVQSYQAICQRLGLEQTLWSLEGLSMRDPWERRALPALRHRFRTTLARLTLEVLRTRPQQIEAFFAEPKRHQRLMKYQRLQQELYEKTAPTNLLPFMVLSAELEGLTGLN